VSHVDAKIVERVLLVVDCTAKAKRLRGVYLEKGWEGVRKEMMGVRKGYYDKTRAWKFTNRANLHLRLGNHTRRPFTVERAQLWARE